jgi:hypothetical protein
MKYVYVSQELGPTLVIKQLNFTLSFWEHMVGTRFYPHPHIYQGHTGRGGVWMKRGLIHLDRRVKIYRIRFWHMHGLVCKIDE